MFKICARTVLQLGAELISSDIVAFYELIKNAFDAQSPNGAEIYFEVLLRRNDYLKFQRRAKSGIEKVDQLKSDVYKALDPSAPEDSRYRFQEVIENAKDLESFLEALNEGYAHENKIIVSDTGTGMSRQDLVENFLSIGTASRKREIDAMLNDHSSRNEPTPYLGEKGIGRLSAMRLGNFLTVETATSTEKHLNTLNIDWSEFDNLNITLDKIDVTPEQGGQKPNPNWSGTRLIVRALAADWTLKRVKDLCSDEFSRLTDPLSDTKCRPRIGVFWNGNRVAIPRLDKALLDHAHAKVKGKYIIGESGPELKYSFEALDLGFDHPPEYGGGIYTQEDLEGLVAGTSGNIPDSALADLGDFEFDAYWFNRRRLAKIDSIGTQTDVRNLQRRWSGILLFRDGFRVLPYGDDDDDWLALDRKALASTGYLLNKTQFIGRVTISRLGNPKLVDQTNRQGLRVCPEQQAFVDLLKNTIQERLRDFLKEVQDRHKSSTSPKIAEAKTDVSPLYRRANAALKKIRHLAPDSTEPVNDLQQILAEFKESFSHIQERINKSTDEKRQLIHMAGVGLLVEVVAHELARSTENALTTIEYLHRKEFPDQIRDLLSTLRAEMISVNKRLRILDPLSISGRQRKEVFDLNVLIKSILRSHAQQFKRHDIKLLLPAIDQQVRVRAVKGMIVQIIENLISNSMYWLDLRRQRDPEFQPEIQISAETKPVTVSYEDNGHGIAKQNQEKIFQAFFSLKEPSKRRGLGLYIARECAEYHGGSLTLDEKPDQTTDRLHRFTLKFPDKIVVA